MIRPAFVGAVLAGGRSTRMGTDKALLAVDGIPMVRRAADVLREAGAETVVAIGGDRAALEALGLTVVEDEEPGAGPLGGIVTALDHSAPFDVVVLACDTPWVSATTIRRLRHALVDLAPIPDVVVAEIDGRAQPLIAGYAARCRERLAASFAAGERSILRALDGCTVATMAVTDPGEARNVNRPTDLPSSCTSP